METLSPKTGIFSWTFVRSENVSEEQNCFQSGRRDKKPDSIEISDRTWILLIQKIWAIRVT